MTDLADIDVKRLRLKPGDKIVFTSNRNISPDQARRLEEMLEERFPDHEALVVVDGELSVIEGEAV